jgi:hypothetical protein
MGTQGINVWSNLGFSSLSLCSWSWSCWSGREREHRRIDNQDFWMVAEAVFVLVPQKTAKGSLLLQSKRRDQLPLVDDLLE